MELTDTIEGMKSTDYQERFIAEYYQIRIRLEKLSSMIEKYKADKLNFTPKCSIATLEEQREYMAGYLTCLQVRAQIEGICL